LGFLFLLHQTKYEGIFHLALRWLKNCRVPVVLCFYLQVFLTSEVGAMAKIVQDLESQLARAQEENAGLNKSLEELDDQHQNAIGL
jgi:hypothetical protein